MSLFCHQCGAENADNATSCRACGTGLANPFQAGTVVGGSGGSLPVGSVPNYLVQAILLTICCCPPFGIVAIVYAAQVNGLLQAGDVAGAKKASASAKMWCWVALALWAVGALAYLAFALIFALAGAAQQMQMP